MVISVGWYTLLRKGALGLVPVLLLCCPAPPALLRPGRMKTETEISHSDSLQERNTCCVISHHLHFSFPTYSSSKLKNFLLSHCSPHWCYCVCTQKPVCGVTTSNDLVLKITSFIWRSSFTPVTNLFKTSNCFMDFLHFLKDCSCSQVQLLCVALGSSVAAPVTLVVNTKPVEPPFFPYNMSLQYFRM